MDWRPWEVRRATIADFLVIQRGWLLKNGVKDEGLSPEEVAEIRSWAFND